MSIKHSAAAWDQDLKPMLKLVLLCLAAAADGDGGGIFLSNRTIAKRAGLHRRSVSRLLGELHSRGLVAVSGTSRRRCLRLTLPAV